MLPIFLQGPPTVMDFEALSVTSGAAVGCTVAKYTKSVTAGEHNQTQRARLATITTETASVRVRFDGTAPTTSVGHLYAAGSTIELQSTAQIQQFLAIATSTSATISITYWGP